MAFSTHTFVNGENQRSKCNSQCGTPDFISDEALLKYKGHLKVNLYLFFCVLWNWDKSGKLGSSIHRKSSKVLNSTFHIKCSVIQV